MRERGAHSQAYGIRTAFKNCAFRPGDLFAKAQSAPAAEDLRFLPALLFLVRYGRLQKLVKRASTGLGSLKG